MTDTRSRAILLFLAAGFAAILLASLYQRFANPDLVVSRFSPAQNNSGASAGQGMSAIGSLMESVAKNPDDRQKLTQLVESLMAASQWGAAENFAQHLLELDQPGQETPRSMFLMAVIHHNQGRHAEAAEMFEKLLARHDDPSARFSLAIIDLHFLNKYAEGVEQLQKALAAPDLRPAMAQAIREELASAQKARPDLFKLSADTGAQVNGAPVPRTNENGEQPGQVDPGQTR